MNQKLFTGTTIAWLSAVILFFGLAGCDDEDPARPIDDDNDSTAFDTLARYREVLNEPSQCQSCHPNHYAEWSASMHAYAVHDPVFLRLNEIGQERSDGELDQFCNSCHTPIASILGDTPPGFDPANLSDMALAGVSCEVCHKVHEFERGKGITSFRTDNVQQGPIFDPVPSSFHESVGDERFLLSDICSSCHDVFSPDGEFLLESTNTEWDESLYNAMGVECQNCHMPEYQGRAATTGPVRTVHRHTFVGVDYPLIDNFPGKEETIRMVGDLLRDAASLLLDIPETITAGEPLEFRIGVLNDRTGHALPSGTIFERQMWLEVIVRAVSTGEIVFQSGSLDPNGDLLNEHSAFVQSGELSRDAQLSLFNGRALKDGKEISFFWEADEVERNVIEAFTTAYAPYIVPPDFSGASELRVSVRLRFRAFPPYLLRQIDLANLIPELRIFDMAESEKTVLVN